MLRIVLLSALVVLSAAQGVTDPRNAAILNEERYLSIDGKFGAAYQQEDGVQFKEESDADGTRRGSYSYLDPTGVRRTISYVAGKNGFQPTGDGIPAIPAPVTNPLPQYNSPVAPRQQFVNPQDDDGQWIDDTKQDYPANSPATWNSPAPAPAPQQWTQSAPAPQWNQQSAPAPQWNQQSAPAPQWNQQSAPAPAQQSWNQPAPAQQSWNQPAPTPAPQRWSAPLDPTPAPHRFFPPGKLNLNRSPDGFSFSFKKS